MSYDFRPNSKGAARQEKHQSRINYKLKAPAGDAKRRAITFHLINTSRSVMPWERTARGQVEPVQVASPGCACELHQRYRKHYEYWAMQSGGMTASFQKACETCCSMTSP